ncbi:MULTISPECIES: NfeD family protein [Thiothrix]|jgi:membrane protein implicated in regulation of membrane protease activity|uniref:NfeD family protein n=1 Tax=Thiothrix unzii TaxID=111769 RepID=A0A975FAL0_9GAMM|nr:MULTISPECIES: NfeD family protein [Thiothrix]MDX9987018.1 NfeD family protein [Thiothrix unzii]QTR53445.1 NfeD family protein [Thiothrix unzii]
MDIQHLAFWHWLVFGVLLMALEVFVPAMLVMWFGFGAIVTGLLLWLIPDMGLSWQLLIFAVVSGVSVLGWRKSRFREENISSDSPDLNNRLHSHIGKEYVLTEAIINGRGTMRVGDTAWRVTGEDLPSGTRVRVTGVDGVLFTVEKAGSV